MNEKRMAASCCPVSRATTQPRTCFSPFRKKNPSCYMDLALLETECCLTSVKVTINEEKIHICCFVLFFRKRLMWKEPYLFTQGKSILLL